MEEWNAKLCDALHTEMGRRMTAVERMMTEVQKQHVETVQRIHTRFDEVAEKMDKRLPFWVTVIITLLTSTTTGLIVVAMK